MTNNPEAEGISFWERHYWRMFIWFWVSIVVGFLLLAVLNPGTSHAPNAVRRMQISNRLKDVGLGLLNYHDTYGSFPPAYVADSDGQPLYSWRVLILPYIEASELYDEFHLDEPWSSEHNQALLAKIPAAYQSPYLPSDEQASGMTPIRGIVDEDKWRTILRSQSGITLDEISDGADKTGLAVADPVHLVEWTKPEDIDPLDLLVLEDLDQTTLEGLMVVDRSGGMHFFDQSNWQDLIGMIYLDDGRTQKGKP